MKYRNTIAITVICLIIGLAVAWQYKSVYNNKKTANVQNVTLEDLKDKLILEKKNNEELRSRNDTLNRELKEFEDAKGNIDLYEKNLRIEVEKANIIAGLTDVQGSGIIISISVNDTDFGWISSRDILEVINALRVAEANAIAVNNERIIAMTEISEVGNYLIINGVPMSSDKTFLIKAIVEPQKLDDSIKMLGSVFAKLEKDDMLSVEAEKVDSITIPKIEKNRPSFYFDYIKPSNK
ncbi:MAG: DUF881 domain-containing protein [Clostridiaceae bacterium]|jgi:uncharacterized protein YlxW (UPF0749 family)|nr:DUF881 domain-containing protein [Clostridiaceae bacterium]